MSFIHLSPLFIPLEPLPIMSPEVMHKRRKKSSGSRNSPGTSGSPSAETKTSPSAKAKGKRPVTSSPKLYPSPKMQPQGARMYETSASPHQLMAPHPGDLTDPDILMAQALVTEPQQAPEQAMSYSKDADAQIDVPQSSSYKEHSFDSEAQAALTFTLESQPMSDLSSSQQID